MEVRIAVTVGDAAEEAVALAAWLRREDEFRGHVRWAQPLAGPDRLGTAIGILTVALSSGGAGAVLARCLPSGCASASRTSLSR